jgi:hypothetical protein
MDHLNRADHRHVALTYLDKLICLGEYLGLIAFESPENVLWGTGLHTDIDQLMEKIEEALKISITPPTGGIHTDGLETKKGLFHYRHINGLYSAIRIQELNKTTNPAANLAAASALRQCMPEGWEPGTIPFWICPLRVCSPVITYFIASAWMV